MKKKILSLLCISALIILPSCDFFSCGTSGSCSHQDAAHKHNEAPLEQPVTDEVVNNAQSDQSAKF